MYSERSKLLDKIEMYTRTKTCRRKKSLLLTFTMARWRVLLDFSYGNFSSVTVSFSYYFTVHAIESYFTSCITVYISVTLKTLLIVFHKLPASGSRQLPVRWNTSLHIQGSGQCLKYFDANSVKTVDNFVLSYLLGSQNEDIIVWNLVYSECS